MFAISIEAPRSLARLCVLPVFVLLVDTASAQLRWNRLSPATSPSARGYHAMAYDAKRGRTVLFGGATLRGLANDTWEFDGRSWLRMSPSNSPPPRAWARMAYDTHRARVVLFGGWQPNATLADTWEWDGQTWAKRTTKTTPPDRSGHEIVYDRARRRMVLFGGSRNRRSLGDTWEYDGIDWRQRTPSTSPPARMQFGMAYDARRKRTVLFGGVAYARPDPFVDTWEWNGTAWRQVQATRHPGPRSDPSMSYDDHRDRVVLYGGAVRGKAIRETWDFDGARWQLRLASAGPDAWGAGMAYGAGRTAVFGGDTRTRPGGDTWVLEPIYPAVSMSFGAGCAGSNGTPSLSSNRPWLGSPLIFDLENLPVAGTSAILLAVGFSKARIGRRRLPLDLGFAGMPGCSLLTSADVLLPIAASRRVQLRTALPNQTSLRGVMLHAQALVPDTASTTGPATVSNGLTITIGSR